MAVPTGVLWDPDPHTEAKHDILTVYLDAWFPIMASGWPSTGICYVDAFAGPGEYTDRSIGSPIIALGAATRPDVRQHSTMINLVFVEKQRGRFEHLQGMVDELETHPRRHVTMRHGAAETVLLPVIDELQLWDGPMFVNFDGWGVDTPYILIERVGKGKRPEVLVTFGPQWFTRFAEVEDVEAGDRVFGNRAWRGVANQESPGEKRRYLVDAYRDRLTAADLPPHSSFELLDEYSHPLFLVFGTTNELGIEKMKDAMWRVDSVSGSKFRDPRDPNLALLQQQILEQLDARTKSLDEFRQFALLETVFKRVHAKDAVDALEVAGAVTCRHARAYSEYIVQRAPPRMF